MTRNINGLTHTRFDVVVVGGGIYGACVAWDASLRGLSVALLEQGDFASGTSANSLKIIHGGFRYLQHGDLRRMRQSIAERKALMRIAPHLVHPLPVLIPTYGHGLRGKEVLACALAMNDLVGFDRNRLQDPQKHIPRGRILSRHQVLQLLPTIPENGLTGGGVFYDGMVYNAERLLLSFLHSAVVKGAEVANYAKVVGVHKVNNRLAGVEVEDVLSGNHLHVEAKVVVNACGPWIGQVDQLLKPEAGHQGGRWVKAFNIVTRPLCRSHAVGLAANDDYTDDQALLNKGKRLFFFVPWREYSLIGTAYTAYRGNPDQFSITEKDIQEFLANINQVYPAANLKLDDVKLVHGGLLPGARAASQDGDIQLEKSPSIHVETGCDGCGVISVKGVKLTTARQVAEQVVDRIFDVLGKTGPPSRTSCTPLYGGNIQKFQEFLDQHLKEPLSGLPQQFLSHLVYNYGSSLSDVLKHMDLSGEPVQDRSVRLEVVKAEVRHAVKEEMAQHLADVVFRRTDLGTAGHPGDTVLRVCAEVMSHELKWNSAQTQQELDMVKKAFPFYL